MPIIVKSAPFRRRIETVAQRLSIWGALRQTCSMSAKSTASRRGDGCVAPSSPIELLQLPGKTPTTTSRKGTELRASPEQPASASALAPCHPFFPFPMLLRWKRVPIQQALLQTGGDAAHLVYSFLLFLVQKQGSALHIDPFHYRSFKASQCATLMKLTQKCGIAAAMMGVSWDPQCGQVPSEQ